jgi:hypothetical protein
MSFHKTAFLFSVFVFFSNAVCSQETLLPTNENYLEDQLYFGLTYNTLLYNPEGYFQNGFSYGTQFGFVKDLPFNKKRSVGAGIGVGFAHTTFNQNLLVEKASGSYQYRTLDTYNNNRFILNSLEFPLEFRWRTSTLEKYKFWRVYTGLTLSYVINFKAQHVLDAKQVIVTNSNLVERFQYALSLSAGYGTWNFYASYALRPLFKEARMESTGSPLNVQSLRLGLMFYML